MSYKPLITGGVMIEVPKEEYEDLVRASEKIETVRRIIAENEFISTSSVVAILGIKEEKKETENKE